MTSFLKKAMIMAVLAVGFMSFAPTVLADNTQTDCGNDSNDPLALDCFEAGGSGLTNTDPRIIASRVINVVLGVLGTIATVLIFYAGFLWMTAAGNDDDIAKAKSIMSAAIIGLVVILASYSIANFFVKSAYKATSGDGAPYNQ